MNIKKTLALLLGTILIFILFSPVQAQMKRICKFQKVSIPYNLRYEDKLLEKGMYDFEVMKDMNQQVHYLRIKKRNKTIITVAGEKQMYESEDITSLMDDPNVPEDPKLRFQRVPEESIVNIIFESGKRINKYPCIKVVFQTGYEEQP